MVNMNYPYGSCNETNNLVLMAVNDGELYPKRIELSKCAKEMARDGLTEEEIVSRLMNDGRSRVMIAAQVKADKKMGGRTTFEQWKEAQEILCRLIYAERDDY